MVVAIIGILAAVAIPAYQGYQENAKKGVVNGSLNIVKKSVRICLVNSTAAQCLTDDVHGSVEAQEGYEITVVDGSSTNKCFVVSEGALSSNKVPDGKVYGVAAFNKTTGAAVDGENVAAQLSTTTAGEAITCG